MSLNLFGYGKSFLQAVPLAVQFVIAIGCRLAALEARAVVFALLTGADTVIEAAKPILLGLKQGIELVLHSRIFDRRVIFQLAASLGNLEIQGIGPVVEFPAVFEILVILQIVVDIIGKLIDIVVEQVLTAGVGRENLLVRIFLCLFSSSSFFTFATYFSR